MMSFDQYILLIEDKHYYCGCTENVICTTTNREDALPLTSPNLGDMKADLSYSLVKVLMRLEPRQVKLIKMEDE